jgi:hypothetical protein
LNTQCSVTTKPATTTNQMSLTNFRLPKSLKPFFYDLTVKTSFDVLTEPNSFDGDLLILVTCLERTNLISIHKAELEISESSIQVMNDANNSNKFEVLSTKYDEDTQIYSITLSQSLESSQNYSIRMTYVGKIQANNFGFYKSFYTDQNGVKRYNFS